MSRTSLQTEEVFTLKDYKQIHTHTHPQAHVRNQFLVKLEVNSNMYYLEFLEAKVTNRILRQLKIKTFCENVKTNYLFAYEQKS